MTRAVGTQTIDKVGSGHIDQQTGQYGVAGIAAPAGLVASITNGVAKNMSQTMGHDTAIHAVNKEALPFVLSICAAQALGQSQSNSTGIIR